MGGGSARAVVIGCGKIGSQFSKLSKTPGVYSHAEAYVKHPKTELVGVCDTNQKVLEEAAALWSVEGSTSVAELCSQTNPDIVSVCTSTESHRLVVEEVLNHSNTKVIVIEKPVASSLEDAEKIVALAKKNGCQVLVNYSRRFSYAHQKIRSEIDAGQYGNALFGRVTYGKGLLNNGGHAIDLLRYWFGEPRSARGGRELWGPEGDSTVSAELEFSSGLEVRLDGVDERVATVFEFDLFFEKTRIRFSFGGMRWEFSDVAESPYYAGYKNYVPNDRAARDAAFEKPLADCLINAIDNAAGALDGSQKILCSGDDGLAVLRWVQKIREQKR